MAARHQDDIITSDIDKNLQEQKMSPCDKVGCSTPDSVGGETTKTQTYSLCIMKHCRLYAWIGRSALSCRRPKILLYSNKAINLNLIIAFM